MTKVTKENLQVSQTIWLPGPVKWDIDVSPMEVVITKIEGEGAFTKILFTQVNTQYSSDVNIMFTNYFHPADFGIPGYAYDNRTCQCFTTKQEMEDAIIMWGCRNPNCIDDNGDELLHKGFTEDTTLGYEDCNDNYYDGSW